MSKAHPFEEGGFPFHDLDDFKFLQSGDPLVDWNPVREWTSSDGRKLTAKVVAIRKDDGDFVLSGGKQIKIKLSALSEEDRRFLREWGEVSTFFNTAYTPSRDLSGKVKAAIFDGVFAKEGKIHETRNFRFECEVPLRAQLAKDFSKLFEVTLTAVSELPLGLCLDRPDGKKILVRLFASETSYIAAGGKKEAAGIYLLKERMVLVPLASLGISPGDNGTYRKKREFDPGTLIHETTHAVMHHWLQHMPLWMAEGLAEYVAAIPYRDGVLDYAKHQAGLRALAAKKFGGKADEFELLPPKMFVHLNPATFMGGRTSYEPPIRLRVVKPFQITLVKPGAPKAPSVAAVQAKSIGKIEPPAIIPLSGRPDPTVVRRYVSSMLLVEHLLERDPASVRKYLFSLLYEEWSRERYLGNWTKTYGLHQDAVQAQISAFDLKLNQFNGDVTAFNAAVDRHNAGESVVVPKRPVVPVPPKAIPVPQILAKPKSPNDLARRNLRKQVIEKHLKLPDRVRLPEE